MIHSNEILAPLGVKRGTSVITIMLVVMFMLGVGMFPGIIDRWEKGIGSYIIIGFLFLVIPLLVFWYVRNKEMRLKNMPANKKSIIILPMMSNIGLAKKILELYKDNGELLIKKIFILKTKDFPKKEEAQKIFDYLEAFGIDIEVITMKSIENPREIQTYFEHFVSGLPDKSNCAVNSISGKATTSVFLYELAKKNDIEIHYISSHYDKENNPVDGTEKLYTLIYQYIED